MPAVLGYWKIRGVSLAQLCGKSSRLGKAYWATCQAGPSSLKTFRQPQLESDLRFGGLSRFCSGADFCVSLQLAQPIRLLLHYVGEDFEDKYYECGAGEIQAKIYRGGQGRGRDETHF